ncbi:hypothetical protein DXG03_003282 [Asterophora parasitica]|uniref:Uncharacterized protein n=1 Tax=Asterophora parasitica TaxID=117018 RepID=A0A9P7KF57_9AGAR|nr:hypothetical protein DXG03_003282 [Asterophora parasitica]
MEHIPSVSRSSGLEKDGDTLKDWKVQEDYRVFLQGKLDDVVNKYPRRAAESEQETNQRVYAQENVLILFRKLREGVSSTRRNDSVALEVYETSLYLAVTFESPKQSTSIIPHLLPHLYLSAPSPHGNRLLSVLISLLHHLVAAYPSQSSFRQHLATIPGEFMPKGSAAAKWIVALARSLRTHNYAAFELLTRPSSISKIVDDHDSDDLSSALKTMSISNGDVRSLPRRALFGLVSSLRSKARETAWEIVRSAYREISCTSEDTSAWLASALCLKAIVPYEKDVEIEEWLEQRSEQGHTRRKEGVDGRWIIYKAR